MNALEWSIFGVIGALVLTVIVGGVHQMFFSEVITLNKSQWECARTERKSGTMPIGKSVMANNKTICVEYKRK